MSEVIEVKEVNNVSIKSRAIAVHTQVVSGTITMLIGLKQMHDEKLYEAIGYKSFKEYVENAINISKGYAYNLLQILDKIDINMLSDGSDFSIRKLYLLSGLPEETRQQLFSGNIAQLPDGKSYTYEQVNAMTTKEVEAITKKKDKEISLLKQDLTEEQNHWKEQIKTLKKQRDDLLNDGSDSRAEILRKRIEELENQLAGYTKIPENVFEQIKKINLNASEALGEVIRVAKLAAYSDEAGAWFFSMCEQFETQISNAKSIYAETKVRNSSI